MNPAGDGDLVTNRSLDEQDTHSAAVAVGYLLSGAVLALGSPAVLGDMLWEIGVF